MKNQFILFIFIFLFTSACETTGKTNISNALSRIFNPKERKSAHPINNSTGLDHDLQARNAIEQGDLTGAVDTYVTPITDSVDCFNEPARPAGDCEEQFTNKDVLYIGDSHSYNSSANGQRMGHQIKEKVNSCGASTFHYRAACGSRPRSWTTNGSVHSSCGVTSDSPGEFSNSSSGDLANIDTLNEQLEPEIVMINLGDNMFGWRKNGGTRSISYIPNSQSIINEIDQLITSLAGKECVWIGPTYHSAGNSYVKNNSDVDRMYELIKSGLNGRCRLIDSRPFFDSTSPNDGLHLTSSESRQWGIKIANEL